MTTLNCPRLARVAIIIMHVLQVPSNNLPEEMAVAEPAAWQTSLKNYHHKLRTGLLIDITLPAFRQLLTAEEYSQVESQKSDVTRVDELVKILLTKDALTFERFCFALEKNGYPGWAGKLRRKGTELGLATEHGAALATPACSITASACVLYAVRDGVNVTTDIQRSF